MKRTLGAVLIGLLFGNTFSLAIMVILTAGLYFDLKGKILRMQKFPRSIEELVYGFEKWPYGAIFAGVLSLGALTMAVAIAYAQLGDLDGGLVFIAAGLLLLLAAYAIDRRVLPVR